MAFITILTILLAVISIGSAKEANANNGSFNAYYSYLYGGDHFSVDPQGTEAQLKIDKSSGAGFRSKREYGSGLFHMRLKISEKKTQGIVTSFYLTSAPDDNPNPGDISEINYEFLGTTGVLSTNVYADDRGNRQQRFKLWFDPSKSFHTYEFLWNSYQIVFLVDGIPIRVYKNNKAQGANFPNQAMRVQATLWDSSSAGPVDWSQAPFTTRFRDFGFRACLGEVGADVSAECYSEKYFWNAQSYKQLNATQQQQMEYYRKKYLIYDYCLDPSKWRKECSISSHPPQNN